MSKSKTMPFMNENNHIIDKTLSTCRQMYLVFKWLIIIQLDVEEEEVLKRKKLPENKKQETSQSTVAGNTMHAWGQYWYESQVTILDDECLHHVCTAQKPLARAYLHWWQTEIIHLPHAS